jgi:hypothetical protein
MFIMIQMFFQVFYKCFQTYAANVLVVIGCMLRIFHLGIVKVDLTLHMLQWHPPATATCCSCWVTSGRRVPAARAPSSRHRRAREKPRCEGSPGGGARKTGGAGSISLAHVASSDASAAYRTFGR